MLLIQSLIIKKYFIGIFLGLTIGLIYTYATPPLYSTLFKVTVSHSGIGTGFLLKSGGIKSMLDDSQLNKDKFPNISLNKKSGIFTVVSKTNSISDSINSKFKKILHEELILLKETAKQMKSNNGSNSKKTRRTLNWTHEDYAALNVDNVLQTLKINFSKTEPSNPKPINHGIIGLFIGLFLAFIWMLLSIITRKIIK